MKFRELCSISGMSGLYQLISTKSDGAIVKNLDDNSTKFVAARSHNVTPLDSIEVYTNSDNMRLMEVFLEIEKNEEHLKKADLTKLDNKGIKALFGKVFPSFDQDKVYVSDMKKIMKWYGVLKSLDLIKAEENTDAEA